MTAALPLSPQVYAILSALIEETLGVHYGPDDRELLAERVSGRALERGFDSLLDYYYFLRYDPDAASELVALAEALVVNETYFFRELEPLRALTEVLLPPLLEGGRRARVWSAACSTGEEPLTLRMLLDARGVREQVELVASDISPRVLARARSGVFSPRSIRAVPPGVMGRWLSEHDGKVKVDPALVAEIDWRRVNLLDRAAVAALGLFDVIVCRHALIYFREPTIKAVVERLAGALRPGGYLLVGTAESLLRLGTSLACEEHRGSFFYRKATP